MSTKEKLTIDQKLKAKKIKKPPYVIYNILGRIWQLLFFKKYGVKVTYIDDVRKEKKPHILISNHSSRMDYIFSGVPALPNTYNFVAGYNEFFRSHLKGVFGLLQVIPKKNFTPDFYTIKEVTRVIKDGGNVLIYPEGMNSISGANQPVAIGTGKFLKHFKIPVYYTHIKGGHLTCPKYTLNESPGRVEVTVGKMFTEDDLERLSAEEIEDILNDKLYQDDYKWNKEHKHVYKTKGNAADGLHDLLFWCPKCGKQLTMTSEKNVIKCTHCGNGATVDDTYEMTPLNEECVIPNTQTEWFNMQREVIKEEVKSEDFSFTIDVDLGVLPDFEPLKDLKTSEIVSEGKLTVDRTGITYVGTKNGENYTFHLNSSEVPSMGMCTDISRFYTFVNGQFTEFYPKTHCTEKFFLSVEEVHRINGGKWQDFKFDKNSK